MCRRIKDLGPADPAQSRLDPRSSDSRFARRWALSCIYVHIRLFVEKLRRLVCSRGPLTIRSGSPPLHARSRSRQKAHFCFRDVYVYASMYGRTRAFRSRDFIRKANSRYSMLDRNPGRPTRLSDHRGICDDIILMSAASRSILGVLYRQDFKIEHLDRILTENVII